MTETRLWFGNTPLRERMEEPSGSLVRVGDETFYRLANHDRMPPFLMSIVSSSDHWMYISSRGGLTAGRVNPDRAIFPYTTDDKLHDAHASTGPLSMLRCKTGEKEYWWEPFRYDSAPVYHLSRDLYKNLPGNKVLFEETNHDLGLTFRYSWKNSDKHGWVREVCLLNHSGKSIEIGIVDGLRNILPDGVTKTTQEQYSTLMDAYKKTELVLPQGLGLFSMSSIPVDRAEPSEALYANTCWCSYPSPDAYLLGENQLEVFRRTGTLITETETRGTRGAYFIQAHFGLQPEESRSWLFTLDVHLDQSAVIDILSGIETNNYLPSKILEDVEKGSADLHQLVQDADGIQKVNDPLASARHFSNVLFNLMRGGIFASGYTIDTRDYTRYTRHFNPSLHEKMADWFGSLPSSIDYRTLQEKAEILDDKDLTRLTLEYLPLSFSRRHGDPSRPWNRFSIQLKNPDGSRAIDYQGNWRDIFQNWETLAYSYPGYLPGMIARFLNTSTADGYNPYRITRDGFEWEVFEPSDPWSFIGYWGDHQVVYLSRLIEACNRFSPGLMASWLDKEWFVYANVPYRVKPYADIARDPSNTIVFDQELHEHLLQEATTKGADAKLRHYTDLSIHRANMLEKLLVSTLVKISNYIPGAGIWLNTQRPEWNDANNALVGHGASMVTVSYLHRFLRLVTQLVEDRKAPSIRVNSLLADFLHEMLPVLESMVKHPATSPSRRREIADALGEAGSRYRLGVYSCQNPGYTTLDTARVIQLLDLAREEFSRVLLGSSDENGLFAAYTLVWFKEKEIHVTPLQEMLEGQVAVLSSGALDAHAALSLLENMRKSKLYRPDQDSYMLYPDKALPGYLSKNLVKREWFHKTGQIDILLQHGVLVQDIQGTLHFNAKFRNATMLEQEMKAKNLSGPGLVPTTLEVYERVFGHKFFTGRSGSFFKYEGLGSIYWHMVSKLLVSVGEKVLDALERNQEKEARVLASWFHEIKKGLGLHKKPQVYGAIPTDPYSHTPSMLGAQQPGMTGQVKEDILSRLMELGVIARAGSIHFIPLLLSPGEFITPPAGEEIEYPFLEFSFCGTPVMYLLNQKENLIVEHANGELQVLVKKGIPGDISKQIFQREGTIRRVIVTLNEQSLYSS